MLQLLLAFGGPGRAALGFEPSYSMHPIITQTTGTRWLPGARDGGDDGFGLDPGRAVAAVRELQPDLVFLTSPNNPTGTAMPLSVIEEVCEVAPGMVVVDEAYAEFARDQRSSALDLLPRYEHLVVTRTMSKAFAMAGARIGYLAAGPPWSAPCRSCGCPITCPRSPRRWPGSHSRTRANCWPRWPYCAASGTSWCMAAGPRPGRGGLRCQLRAVRRVRRPARGLAGAAGPRGADPRGRAAGLAAGERRHGGGDGRVPGRAGRGARMTGDRDRAGRARHQGDPGPGRARPGRHGSDRGADRGAVLRPHARPARQARLHRPDRAGPGRHRDRRASHRGGHRAGARPGAARGAGRQGGDLPVRRRADPAGRDPGPGRGGPVRKAVCGAHRTGADGAP